jgi:hypothetical protein
MLYICIFFPRFVGFLLEGVENWGFFFTYLILWLEHNNSSLIIVRTGKKNDSSIF